MRVEFRRIDPEKHFDADFISKRIASHFEIWNSAPPAIHQKVIENLTRNGDSYTEAVRKKYIKEAKSNKYHYRFSVRDRLVRLLQFWMQSQMEERSEEDYDPRYDWMDIYHKAMRFIQTYRTESAILLLHQSFMREGHAFPIQFDTLEWLDVLILDDDSQLLNPHN